MNRDLFIITGGSKGIGAALVSLALSNDHDVINISRNAFKSDSKKLKNVSIDFKKLNHIDSVFSQTLSQSLNSTEYQTVHLILNAAQIEPIGLFQNIPTEQIVDHMSVNFTSAVYMLKKFLEMNPGRLKTVTALTSGAATQPISGWSAYCSSKAALHLLIETLKLELSSDSTTRIYNFSPGVVDTDMQSTIRTQPARDFSRVDEFINLKNDKKLRKPAEVALEIYNLLNTNS